MIVFSAIMPHPPESIPGIGNDASFSAISKTLHSFDVLRKEFEESDPDTVIVISPHAKLEKYAFVINSASELNGSLANFGQDEAYSYKNNIEVVEKIDFACLMDDLPVHLHPDFLDHGTIIPLYHLLKNIKPKVIQMSFSMMSYQQHYRYGEIIQSIINKGSGRFAVIASGDLSHRLNKDSPAGYFPGAQRFDLDFLRFLGSNDLASIMGMEQDVIENAAECGVRSIIIMLGMLHGKNFSFKLLSYEAPFGIGYLTGRLL